MKLETKRLALMGMLTALAMICGYVEMLLPISIGIPGVKLGLANIVTVFALYRLRTSEALAVNVMRIVLVSFMFGNMSVMLYSIAGGLTSFAAMALLKKTGKFSIYGVSIAGGVFHNVGQLIVAMIVLETASLVYYGAVLLVAGLVTGLLIGITANEIMKRIRIR